MFLYLQMYPFYVNVLYIQGNDLPYYTDNVKLYFRTRRRLYVPICTTSMIVSVLFVHNTHIYSSFFHVSFAAFQKLKENGFKLE